MRRAVDRACCPTETQLDVQCANGLGAKRLQLAPQET